MPHSLGPVVVAAAVAELVGFLFVAAVLGGLQQAFPRAHMRSWGWSFLAGGMSAGVGIVSAAAPLAPAFRPLLTLAAIALYYLQAALLLQGSQELRTGTPAAGRRPAIRASLLVALGSVLVSLAGAPLAWRAVLRFILPPGVLVVCMLFAAWQLLRAPEARSRTGVRLMAGALGLLGIERAHGFLLQASALLGRELPGYPAYLGLVDLALLGVFALGAVVSLLDEERSRLLIAEEKFTRVFRFSPDVIVVTLPGEGGLIVDVNERFEQLTGHRREEAVGRTTVDLGLFVEPEERTAIWEESRRGLVREREVRFRMKNGDERVLSLAVESFELEGREYAVAVARDMTARQEAERELRESEERFRRLAAASFEGIAMSEGGVVLDANEQLAEMLSCPVKDLVGRPVQDFVAAESQEVVQSRLTDASTRPYGHLARRVDGTVFPVEVRARTIPYEGRTIRLTAVRDVSRQVEAEARQGRLEAELREAAQEWRQTFDALDLGILLVNPEGCLVRLNRRALQLAERSSFESVLGQSIDALSSAEPWRTLARHRGELESRGASVGSEVHDSHTGRSYYVLVTSWHREEGRPPWSVLTFRDVTDFVAVQEQLRKARLMETMGSLVAGVAHEVRNPLFSISATVDAMEAGFRPLPEFEEHAEVLRSQVGRLTRLMRDLLDYGKPSLLQLSPGQLADVVRRAARSCAALAGERQVRIETEVADDLPTVPIDGPHLEQACENLVSNAIQHAPKGSVVSVKGRLAPDRTPPCVRLSVEDEGPGLAPESLARVFEPFYTRRAGGTGLGLSIVQRVVEAHGGEVTARNRPGRGACFVMSLPVSAEEIPRD